MEPETKAIQLFVVGKLLTDLTLKNGEIIYLADLTQNQIPFFLNQNQNYHYLKNRLSLKGPNLNVQAFDKNHNLINPKKTVKGKKAFYDVWEQKIVQLDVESDFLKDESDFQKKKEEIKKETADDFGDFAKLQRRIDKLEEKNHGIEKELAESRKNFAHMEAQTTKLKSENEEMKAENREMKERIGVLETQTAELKDQNVKLKAENEEIKAQNAELKFQFNGVVATVAELSERMIKLQESFNK